MTKKITGKQARELYNSEFYKKLSHYDIVKFQLFEPMLCMPFDIFHEAVEKVLKRPVFTHEFAFIDSLKKEFLGEKTPPTFKEIMDLIPEDKRIIVLV